MPRCRRGLGAPRSVRPPLDIADIFRTHGEEYRQRHALSREQRATMRAIVTCRTAARGGHLDVCDQCGYARPAYNSCRNRHCPKCEALREARWIEARMARLVPSHYFHVVFTLPATLRPLVLRNRRRLFTLLFRAATQTLLTVGRDPARLGARLGVTAVLHTWTRDLQFHPHLHCIVTGGGLALDPPRWIATARRHLFPVRVLSRLFRGKFLAALARAYAAGHLDLAGGCTPLADPHAFARFKGSALPPGLDRLRQAPLRGPAPALPLPRPLHASRRTLQSPPARRHGHQCALRDQARARRHARPRGVHPPLPAPRPTPWLRQDPSLRSLRAGPGGVPRPRARPPPARRHPG